LLDHGVSIEHWTARAGQRVPEWFQWSTERYHEKATWARRQFSTGSMGALVETYSDEFYNGSLHEALAERLTAAGVPLQPLSYQALVERIYEFRATRTQAA
jgi:DNA helicase-4